MFDFPAIQPDDGGQIFDLPFRPLVERAIDDRVIIACVDEKHLVQQRFRLALVEEPERAGQGFGVEKVVADAHHHIDVAGLDELFADALVAGLAAVRCGGRHDKTRAAGIVQIGVKVGNPEVVGISDFLVFVDAW